MYLALPVFFKYATIKCKNYPHSEYKNESELGKD